jgi:hypothetical protein
MLIRLGICVDEGHRLEGCANFGLVLGEIWLGIAEEVVKVLLRENREVDEKFKGEIE